MPKTLADMTPAEREECRGIWCDFPDPNERTNLAIYVGESTKHDGFCEIIHEGEIGYITLPETLTPRYDLPRAWHPDGKPPKGEWEHPEGEFEDRGGGYSEYVHEPIRRWVGEWEELP